MIPLSEAARLRDQVLAMRDASVGALEAARLRYQELKSETEEVSIGYVYGHTERDDVRRVTEAFLTAEQTLKNAMDRVKISQQALEELTVRLQQSLVTAA